MKNLLLTLTSLLIIILSFQACLSIKPYTTSGKTYPPTNANEVALFIDALPDREYIEIGRIDLREGEFSDFPTDAKLYDKMKEAAASIGGHAIINIDISYETGSAVVIRFQ